MDLTNDELRKRVALLERIKELEAEIPNEETMEQVAGYVGNLQALKDLDAPTEREIEEAKEHLAALQAINEIEKAA